MVLPEKAMRSRIRNFYPFKKKSFLALKMTKKLPFLKGLLRIVLFVEVS